MKKRLTERVFAFLRSTKGTVVLVLAVCAFIVIVSPLRILLIEGMLTTLDMLPPHDNSGQFNVLLLGVGDKNHDGADLTDAMVIVNIDPLSRSTVLLSVPRDLYLSGSTIFGPGRINRLYVIHKTELQLKHVAHADIEHLALALTAGDISQLLSVPIHGVIKADFTAFTRTVDAFGGIDIDVPKSVTDYTYPIHEGVMGTFAIKKGMQHLDGETALKYARSRHSTSDFDRSERQQLVLHALKAKIGGLHLLQDIAVASTLPRALSGHVITTMSIPKLIGLALLGSQMRGDRVLNYQIDGASPDGSPGGFMLGVDPALYGGADVLLPWAPGVARPSFAAISVFARFVMQQRFVLIEHARVQVRGTKASKLSAELQRYGFDAHTVIRPKAQVAPAQSQISCGSSCPTRTLFLLSRVLDLPIGSVQTGSGVFIDLSPGYRFAPLHTLPNIL